MVVAAGPRLVAEFLRIAEQRMRGIGCFIAGRSDALRRIGLLERRRACACVAPPFAFEVALELLLGGAVLFRPVQIEIADLRRLEQGP